MKQIKKELAIELLNNKQAEVKYVHPTQSYVLYVNLPYLKRLDLGLEQTYKLRFDTGIELSNIFKNK